MSKKLVAYFSASGVTASLAKNLAAAIGADLFEIEPVIRYGKADLDWTNKKSRSSVEMNDKSSRPAVAKKLGNMSEYDEVFVGFPIWWYIAPTIVNTFLEGYDLAGKTIIPFATSGGSGMGETNEYLANSCKGAKLVEGKVLRRNACADELKKWAEEVVK
ncbi:MAG: flavodoxin [Clostridia bacterium]|nr:flavodoxin [Clostridia bacterium]